jgi:UDP-N-acetyl-D-glucosamine dehydrogenase
MTTEEEYDEWNNGSPTPTPDAELLDLIESRTAKVVVIGGGYVGLPLAIEISKVGFHTSIFDTDPKKVAQLNEMNSAFRAAESPQGLKHADIIVVCVPTPLNKTKDPDNSFVVTALNDVRAIGAVRPQLVIIESTTFPGFTREVARPLLESCTIGSIPKHLNQHFFLAFSPERVDPGNKTYGIQNTPKIVGGASTISRELAMAFYSTFVDTVVPVSSTDAAEMTKLLENTFRAVNIGLVNEIAIMCQHLKLDVWELIDAAATKPFGFMPFYPGPGLGGHCIPVDPRYLAWRLRTLKYAPRFIDLADAVNSAMPAFVVQRVADALNDRFKAVRGSKILIVGVTYKRDVDDVRESPAFDVIEGLLARGAAVEFYDKHVPALNLKVGDLMVSGLSFVPQYGYYDCAVIVTDHVNVDYTKLVAESQRVVDCRNATKGIVSDKIVRV